MADCAVLGAAVRTLLLLLGAEADSNEKLVHEQAREQCEIIMNMTSLVKRSADSA